MAENIPELVSHKIHWSRKHDTLTSETIAKMSAWWLVGLGHVKVNQLAWENWPLFPKGYSCLPLANRDSVTQKMRLRFINQGICMGGKLPGIRTLWSRGGSQSFSRNWSSQSPGSKEQYFYSLSSSSGSPSFPQLFHLSLPSECNFTGHCA